MNTKPKRDEEREERITMEIVVDAYDAEEQALGWYYYLEEKLTFPFTATCVAERPISPLRINDEVEVAGMPPAAECEREMFVFIDWGERELAVPLSQLEPIDDDEIDEETLEAVEDWHYWVRMGRQFG